MLHFENKKWVFILDRLENYTHTQKLHTHKKKKKKKKLPIFSSKYRSDFYQNLNDSSNQLLDSNFHKQIDYDTPSEDVQNYLLTTSDFGKGMQDDINMWIINNKLNNASFRQKLDCPAEKLF